MRLSSEIVAGMRQLALDQRRLLGPRQHEGREKEWKIRLWVEDGRVVAWSWLKEEGPYQLEHDVHPEHLLLLDEILADHAARVAFAFEDDPESRAAFTRHGFTQPGTPMHYLVRDLAEPPELPPLPDGFRCRTVRAEDIPERVSLHREVWSRPDRSSRVTALRCGACTRKAGAKRSSAARRSPPAHSTSQWASESMRHWLSTPATAEPQQSPVPVFRNDP